MQTAPRDQRAQGVPLGQRVQELDREPNLFHHQNPEGGGLLGGESHAISYALFPYMDICSIFGNTRSNGASFWEANHKVAVADGGGECGIDNLETLCVPCHLQVTLLDYRDRRMYGQITLDSTTPSLPPSGDEAAARRPGAEEACASGHGAKSEEEGQTRRGDRAGGADVRLLPRAGPHEAYLPCQEVGRVGPGEADTNHDAFR